MDYLTIENEYYSELIVQKSRFICFLFPCQNITYFNEKIKKIKKDYYDATHVVPAYRILRDNNQIKEHFSDDREPAKTAGWPLLYILQQKELIQIGTIVIRYFGGIKLGTSGLQKSYSEVLLNTILKAKLIEYSIPIYKKILIPVQKEHFWYELIKNDKVSDNFEILKSDYLNFNSNFYISFQIKTNQKTLEYLIEKLSNVVKEYKIVDGNNDIK